MWSYLSLNHEVIVFVGPQGSGKTTHARLLCKKLQSLRWKTCCASLTHYTFFHLKLTNLLRQLCRNERFKITLCEGTPPETSSNSEIYRKLFGLLVLSHLVSFALSFALLKLLLFFYERLLEDDGYVLKQIADLYYFANIAKIDRHSIAGRLSKTLVRLLLSSLAGKKLIIIHLEVDSTNLQYRYIERKTHVEPSNYIDFQNGIYAKLSLVLNDSINGRVAKLDASQSISQVHQQIIDLVQ